MEALPPGLAAHKGLRGQILIELKRDQPLTTRQLAGRHAVSANAIRRHLKELEVDGLVVYDREQRGFGAPVFVYRLTPQGEAIFPRQYGEALTDVLSFVAQASGREAVRRIFAERFRTQAGQLKEQLAEASLQERLQAVVDLLTRQGFMAEWSVDGNHITIAEHNCAVQAAAEQFPEICQAEADFLKSVLETEVSRSAYIPGGCNACEYSLKIEHSHQSALESGTAPPEES